MHHTLITPTDLVWNSLIALSYFAISCTLLILLRYASLALPYWRTVAAFGGFILFCGIGHAVMVLDALFVLPFWSMDVIDFLTAAASVATAVMLPFHIRPMLRLIAAAQQARQGYHYYRMLAQNMPATGVILFSSDLTAKLVEGSVFRDAGYDPASLEQKNLLDVIPPDALPVYLPLYRSAVLGRTGSLMHTSTNGRTYAVHAVPIIGDSDVAAMAVIQEVTERKQLEIQLRQAQKMEGIGRMAGGIAHDFNNLLTAIHGITELLQLELDEQQVPAESQIRSDADEILRVTKRATTLTRQLLAFSRQQIISPRLIHINDVVLEIVPLLRRILPATIEVVTLPADDLPPVIVDPSQMEQVLMNLAVNAQDAMPHGGRFTIATSRQEGPTAFTSTPGPGAVLISVQDTGAGMPANVLERAFDPFFTTKPSGKGTGLGLATCYGIIQQHGGTISIESVLQRGTTIMIALPPADHSPLPHRTGDEPIVINASLPSPALTRGTGTILVVEDERAVLMFARRALETCGYAVRTATNGHEAIQLLEELNPLPDLVLTDVIMPLMGGPDLAAAIQVRWPQLPVLFMSGYTDNTITHSGVIESGIAFLQKPFTTLTLSQAVAAARMMRGKKE